MRNRVGRVVAAILFAGVIVDPTRATTIATSSPLNFLDVYGVNPVGVGTPIGTTGYYSGTTEEYIGFASVSPYGTTSIVASQGNASYSLFRGGNAAFPTQIYRYLPFSASTSQLGPWTLTLTNAGTTNSPLVETTSTISLNIPPPVSGISLTGDKLAPTVSWVIPTGSTATAENIFVYQITPGGSSQLIYTTPTRLPATATTYAVPTGLLSAGGVYSIAVQSNTYNGSGVLSDRTDVFTAAFAASAGTFAAPVFLPVVASDPSAFGGPVYTFDVPVTAGQPVIIDPAVALGYIYQTGANDPNFASVLLPDIGNPTPYSLYLWNGSTFVFDTLLAANTLFSFGAGGVSEFEVLGISPSDFLNPYNVSAFMTQLTFVAEGTFTGTMTPIIANVPEPSEITLLWVAMLGLVAARRSPRRSNARERMFRRMAASVRQVARFTAIQITHFTDCSACNVNHRAKRKSRCGDRIFRNLFMLAFGLLVASNSRAVTFPSSTPFASSVLIGSKPSFQDTVFSNTPTTVDFSTPAYAGSAGFAQANLGLLRASTYSQYSGTARSLVVDSETFFNDNLVFGTVADGFIPISFTFHIDGVISGNSNTNVSLSLGLGGPVGSVNAPSDQDRTYIDGIVSGTSTGSACTDDFSSCGGESTYFFTTTGPVSYEETFNFLVQGGATMDITPHLQVESFSSPGQPVSSGDFSNTVSLTGIFVPAGIDVESAYGSNLVLRNGVATYIPLAIPEPDIPSLLSLGALGILMAKRRSKARSRVWT